MLICIILYTLPSILISHVVNETMASKEREKEKDRNEKKKIDLWLSGKSSTLNGIEKVRTGIGKASHIHMKLEAYQ